jgi:hypothetical protein
MFRGKNRSFDGKKLIHEHLQFCWLKYLFRYQIRPNPAARKALPEFLHLDFTQLELVFRPAVPFGSADDYTGAWSVTVTRRWEMKSARSVSREGNASFS